MKRCCSCAVVFALLVPAVSLPGQALETRDGLKLKLDRGGRVESVATGGRAWLLAGAGGSGLLMRDAAADGTFVGAGGTVAGRDGAVLQHGTQAALKLQFQVEYRALPKAIDVRGFIRDVSGKDRAITVRLALPIDATGVLWWPDIVQPPQQASQVHHNLRATHVGATGTSSRYPWGVISSGAGALCLGIPMDRFVVHRIGYDAQTKSFYVDFDFGLSPLTKAFPSRADFALVIYASDPRWGFRAASAKYYSLFPEAFKRRAEKEGLWMPFTDIAKVKDPEDFNFIFQEGAPNIAYDEAHGIYSFKYISPHWAWLWMPDRKDKPTPEFVKQKLAQDLKSDNAATRKRATLIVNSAPRNANGDYHYSIGRAHWAPSKHGPMGWFACFPANADPDLGQLGKGPTTGTETMAAVERLTAQYNRPGAFLDGFYFDGVDERPLDNYAQEQFAFAESPLTFGADTRRPIMCGAFSSYKFLKQVAERMHSTGRMVIANGVPSQFPFSAAYLDAGGAELEPPIDNEPVRLSYLTSARTLLYHKPLLLLYKPRLEERFDRDLSPYLVDYMNTCLLYAAEPSLFKIFSKTNLEFYYSFFERPDWYNKYRPIFVQYLPLVKKLALAGWEPVTGARASDPRAIVERFGSGADLHLVAYNPLHRGEAIHVDLDVELDALDWPQGVTPVVADLLNGSVAPVAKTDAGVRVSLALPARRAAVLAFRPSRSRLADMDLDEAVRYVHIASSRLADKLDQKLPVDFEDDTDRDGLPTGYSKYTEGAATYASDEAVFHSAPRSTKVTLTGRARATLSTTVQLRPGRRYRLSLWGKAEFPTTGSLHFYARWKDERGKLISPLLAAKGVHQTSDWQRISLELTAPAQGKAVYFVMVGSRRGEGEATVWFDDPAVVELGPDGRETTLLPMPRKPAPAWAGPLAAELGRAAAEMQAMARAAAKGADAAALCTQALGAAAAMERKAESVRQGDAEYANVAAALATAASRLRRAGGILSGWQMRLAAPATITQGEAPELAVRIVAGAMPLSDVRVTVKAPDGWDATPSTLPRSLAPGLSATATVALKQRGAGAPGGTIVVTARAAIADGHQLAMQRDTSFAVASPCESAMVEHNPKDRGRVRRMLLTVRNRRRTSPLAVDIAVSKPADFATDWTDRSVEIKAGGQAVFPIGLAADDQAKAGWRQTTVTVSWDRGQTRHELPFLYAPPAANLLSGKAWRPYGDSGYRLDTQVMRSGTPSVRAVNSATVKSAGASQAVVLNQKVARPLVLHGWSLYRKPGGDAEEIKTIGMTEHAGLGDEERTRDYSLYLDLHYVGGGALYGQAATFDKARKGWQFSHKVIHVAKPVRDATLYLLFRGQQGTAWFGDVFLAQAEPNLAQTPGAEITTDSSYSGYTPKPLIDGVADTANVPWDKAAWASAESKGDHWAQIDLPKPATVRTVVIYWAIDVGATWTSRTYSVQAFVDGSWREVANVTGAAVRDFSVHNFTPVATSRVRVLQPEGGGPAKRPLIMWLREIEVF